jgi:hypothetical protein
LAAVNFFLFLANGYQFGRLVNYNYFSDKDSSVKEDVKQVGVEVKEEVVKAGESLKNAVTK